MRRESIRMETHDEETDNRNDGHNKPSASSHSHGVDVRERLR